MAGNGAEQNNDQNYDSFNGQDSSSQDGSSIDNRPMVPSSPPSQDQYDDAFAVSGRQNDDNIPGKIGQGDDAKNSVVWHVITYSLTIYSCIVAALLVIDVVGNGGQSALTIVKDSWAIFTPIITLSLGYMFGKKEEPKQTSSSS